jgi:uncharacterized alpha-E superfamily protein
MLLSRVAESVYWIGRYLERAEDTARFAQVHTELFLDLPQAAGLEWATLLAVTGSADAFGARFPTLSEEEVIAFLATDADNPGSIIASLSQARAGLRTTRSSFPGQAWHILNSLHHWAAETSDQAAGRRTRLGWLSEVVERCQLLQGALDGAMTQDATWSFLQVGRFLERADMTTRVLDVQAGVLIGVEDSLAPYSDVAWMSVLKSLGAQQMYRRAVGGGVSGPDALRFLLQHPQFPRSVEHSLTAIARSLLELPRCQEPMAACAELERMLEAADVDELAVADLHEWVDGVQTVIGRLHDEVAETYFRMSPSAPGVLLPTG